MSYEIIQPPFTLNFSEMPRKELREYFHWVLEVIPQRVRGLAQAVRESEAGKHWESDFSAASLDILGDWFANQAETRLRTVEEIEEIEKRSRHPIEIPREELTNRTFSLAMDVGLYLSQVFL